MKRKYLIAIQYLAVILIFASVIINALLFTIEDPKYSLILSKTTLLWKAFYTTIYISLFTLIGTMIIGFILFVMKRSKIVILNAIADVFNEIIMGTPLLVMIFLVVYILGPSIDYTNKLMLGILSLVLYNSPYIANAYHTAAAVIDEDQYIVMDLYQFKWYEKYCHIIIPQMIKPFIPSLINNLSSVIKSSALLNIVAVLEISYVITSISSSSFAFIEGYYVMWIMYLIVTIPLSLLAKYLAKRVSV